MSSSAFVAFLKKMTGKTENYEKGIKSMDLTKYNVFSLGKVR
jgi:hypothetical protein